MLASEDMSGAYATTPAGQAELEANVLSMMMEQADTQPFGPAFRRQLASTKPSRRQLSGVGFFLDFHVSRDLPEMVEVGRTLPLDVYAQSASGDVIAGFILFADEPGYVSMLEGYTYDGEWPEDVSNMILTRSVEELSAQ